MNNIDKFNVFSWLRNIQPGFIFLGLIVIFLGKHLIPIEGNFIGGSDVQAYHFWNILYLKKQILSGSFPLWNPYMYCGHPFLANPGNFVLYPFVLLYILLPITIASNLDILVHLFIAGMGTYYLVYKITESKGAALASAIVYSLSGHMIDSIYAGHLTKIHAAAMLPWIFYFIEKVFCSEQMKYLIGAGFLLGVQILTGNNQDNLYTSIFVSIYYLIRYFAAFKKFEIHHFIRYILYFLLVPAVSFGISAAQLIPTLEFLSLSDRAHGTYEFATFMSFSPRNFFTFLVPKPESGLLNTNWEFGCYIGILSLPIALIGLIFSKARRMTVCLLIMLLLSLSFMMGSYTPMYILYYKVFPFIPQIRVPARCLIMFVFFLSILVGLGTKYLVENPDKKKLLTFLSIALPVFLCILFIGAITLQIVLSSKPMIVAFCLTGVTFSILYAIPYLKNRQLVTVLIIGTLFVDLYLIYNPTIPNLNHHAMLQKQNYEKYFDDNKQFFRVNIPITISGGISDFASRGNVFHYYNVNGYIPIVMKDFYRFVHYMADIPVPLFLRHTLDINLFRPDLVFSSKILGIKYAFIFAADEIRMIKAQWHMPRALLVRNALIVPRYENHLALIKHPSFNPMKTVILEKDFNDFAKTLPSSQGKITSMDSVQITYYSSNRIDLSSYSAGNSYLLLSELFYPGWMAYIDGKMVPILRADYLLRAIPLSSGHHKIKFIYRPLSLMVGLVITVFTLFALLIAYVVMRRQKDLM